MKKPMKKIAKGKPAKAKGKMPAFLEKKMGNKGKDKPGKPGDKPMGGKLSAAQKKLPPALQAAIMKKKKN
jgi:hypothetical protein